jgi:hypothetical protein
LLSRSAQCESAISSVIADAANIAGRYRSPHTIRFSQLSVVAEWWCCSLTLPLAYLASYLSTSQLPLSRIHVCFSAWPCSVLVGIVSTCSSCFIVCENGCSCAVSFCYPFICNRTPWRSRYFAGPNAIASATQFWLSRECMRASIHFSQLQRPWQSQSPIFNLPPDQPSVYAI